MSGPEMSDDSAAAGPAIGAGAALLKERRRQGLSLGDISRQLKLSVRQVEALERDDYSSYKGPVFIHGFIRNYAKLLGLDPEPLIRATDTLLSPPALALASQNESARPRAVLTKSNSSRLWPSVGAVVLVGLALAVYFGGRRAPDMARNPPSIAARERTLPKSPEEPKRADKKAKGEPGAEAESTGRPATKAPERSETGMERRPRAEAPASVTAQTDAANIAEASERVTVRMIFEQDSWVEIKDRNGNTIFGQLNFAGSRRSISGAPPLSVVVGNAAGVRLFQGDKSIDLGPHTRVDVARVTLE